VSAYGARGVAAGAMLALLAGLVVERRRHDAQLAELRARMNAISRGQPAAVREWKPQMTWEAVRDGYERAFALSPPDTSATELAMTEVTPRLVHALPKGSVVRSFECREAMCRLETSHIDLAQYKTFLAAAFRNSSTQLWRTQGSCMPLGEEDDAAVGPRLMVCYIARQGQSLPLLTN